MNRLISFGSNFAYFNNNLFSYTHVLAAFWDANPLIVAKPNKTTDDIVHDILKFDYRHNDLVIVQWHTDCLNDNIKHCIDYIKNHHHTKKRNFHINTGTASGFDIVCNLPSNTNNQLLIAEKIKRLTTVPN